MKELTLYDYIQIRINGKRTDSIVQDLIDDMKRDEVLKDCAGWEIVRHIQRHACVGCLEALSRFLSSYRQYCKRHGYQCEEVSIRW